MKNTPNYETILQSLSLEICISISIVRLAWHGLKGADHRPSPLQFLVE